MGENGAKQVRKPHPTDVDVTTFSNAIRLTGREWLLVGLFAALLSFLPSLWKQWENLELEPDYRMPHDLSNDYWLFERYAGLAAGKYDTLLVGDSVIWGEYVTGKDTLSHYLNLLSGLERYANLGIDGAHPLALEGLVEHYAPAIAGKTVLLHCNPLWLSSPRADLQDETVSDFNHPRLVPQFVPRIPSYKEEISPRIGVVVEQHFPLSSWANHLQQAYYDRSDIPSWTLEHPYENPAAPLARGLPPPDHTLRHPPRPWFEIIKGKLDYEWVDLDTSLQWQAFQRLVTLLKKRGNRVFVLVGPFNEHLLNPRSLERYQEIKAGIKAWLQAQQIPHAALPALPSEQYGDASHPLAAGYALLARELLDEPFFSARPAEEWHDP
jgi:hypothetical protein